MKKTLVVCYSLGGATRTVADHVARALGAELDEIEDVRPRGFFATLRGALESVARGLPAIRYQRDPKEYDLVVLATPVWGMSMSSPMRSYLHDHRGALPRVACLCTYGGFGGYDAAFDEMKALAGDDRAPTVSIHERDVRAGRYADTLRPFVDRLRAVPAPAARAPMPRSRAS